jgi:YD repeat-containing protein
MSSSEGGNARPGVNLCGVPEDRQYEVEAAVLAVSRLSVLGHLRGVTACVTRASVIALLLLVMPPMAVEAAGAQYVYDAAGRLVQVIGPSGTSAQYTYDAAGNLLAVTPLSASTAAVTGFSNASGTTGSTLTIYGSGFSTTPGNNYVYFNGVAATVTSSTTNSLTVTVPSGATTGTIRVTDSNGTVTSAHNFAVSSVPSIASFSPAIGAPGTTVTVSGSNFPASVSAVQATINGVAATVTSSSASSLTLTVPSGATPGPIVLTTATGTATSTADFFALAPGVSPSVVAMTGQLTIDGSSLTATIGTAGKYGIVAFAGSQGQTISIQASSESFPSSCGLGSLGLYGPAGTSLDTLNFCAGGTAGTLPTTATYFLLIAPYGTDTGSVTLRIQSAPVVTAPITIGGSPVTLTTTVPAQSAQLTFTTTSANQTVSLEALSSTYPSGSCTGFVVNVYGPAPAPLLVTSLNPCLAAQVISLPTAGTYVIAITTVTPSQAVGSVTLQMQNAPPATGTATLGGSSVTLTTTVPAQQSKLSFTTTSANQIVSFQILSDTYSSNCAYFSVNVTGPAPATTAVTSLNACLAAQLMTLPTAGTYTVTVSPDYTSTAVGSLTVKLQNAPLITGTATIGGAAVTLTTTVPAQLSLLSFTTTTANQTVTLVYSGVTYPSADCASDLDNLVGPAPSNPLVATGTLCYPGYSFPGTFPTPGTYTFVLTPYGTDTGSITYQLH